MRLPSIRFAALALLGFALCGVCSSAHAQTAGLTCTDCGASFSLFTCTGTQKIETPGGCTFINCQKPITTEHGVEIIQTGTAPDGSGIFEARLLVEIEAHYNFASTMEGSGGPNSKLDMWWRSGSTATHPTSNLCENNTHDQVYTYLRRQSLTCNGAPYNFGTYSMRAVVCGGAGTCEKRTDVNAMAFTVTEDMLSCPNPPKEACNGDASCTTCLAGGVSAGGAPPAFGGSGWPSSGPGATLRYTAGGVGHPGYPGTTDWTPALGRYWSHDYAMRIVPDPDEEHVWLLTEYGTFREWSTTGAGGVYQAVSPSNEYRTLAYLGIGNGWELAELDGTVHTFASTGSWLSTTDRNGNAKVATYSGAQLVSVDFPDGRREDFGYDVGGKLQTIDEVGVDGVTTRSWTYTWAGNDLSRIDRPDGTALVFRYDEPSFRGYMTRVELEGDDNTSIRVLRAWEYDAEGNVLATWKGDDVKTGPDAVDLWIFAYDDPSSPTETTATDPLGNASIYQFERDTVSSNVKVTSISGDCPTCGLGPNTQLFYDDPNHPMLPTRTIDGRGFTTMTAYTPFGRVESMTEAVGQPEERTTSWTYDATFPALVESIERPSVDGGAALRTTDYTRDASGNAFETTTTGVEDGSAFVYTTTTTFNVAGMPETIDPPGHGTDDLTTYTYYSARGSLIAESRIDPIVGTTTFGLDPFNRLTSETDPNGVATENAYDELDRVTEVRQLGASPPTGNLVTAYEYTVFGDLERTILPAGNVIEYGYDIAGRLESVEKKLDATTPGERVFYTLDETGNRTSEKLQRWDAGSSAWVTTSETTFEYTARCRPDRVTYGAGTASEAVVEFEYDCNGNLSAEWDPNHDSASDPATRTYSYDALDRLDTVTEPWAPAGGTAGSAVTTYSYDVQDHLASVTDAEGSTTNYTFSDRDLLIEEVSVVSGTTTRAYDEHGKLLSMTDARSVTVTRTVDAADRVVFVDYPDDILDTTYSYDAAPAVCGGTSFPLGRLGSITRNAEAVEYCYDRFGRTTRDGEIVYVWDDNSNRTGISYPGGVSASYGFDFADREASLSVTTPGGVEGVVTAASYLPSGPLSSLAMGSGTSETRGFDGRYVPTGIGISGDPMGVGDRSWAYATDKVGNILSIVEEATCSGGNVLLENQTVTTTETFTSCADLEAGNGFSVESPGDVRFEAAGRIVLSAGFSVGSGASFVAAPGEDTGPLSERTYTYQAPQYFLTAADGPWGTLDWIYDRIGNRLAESRNGATADTYIYLTNGSGNTPILDQVALGVGGVRDYTWGAAGHLEEVDATGNVIDFTTDAAGRLATVSRAIASESAAFAYDGRSYLGSAAATAGGTSSVDPIYDSGGLIHALRRKDAPASPEQLVVFLYLAGRPVAQVAIDGGTETWRYLTTDHLGTPMLATDDAGAVTWEGGFEPFGTDYQAGLASGALENDIYLRLPGQWMDESWEDASSGAGIYYNVNRWYGFGLDRYTRPDPAGIVTPLSIYNPYVMVRANPISFVDPLGFDSVTDNPFFQDCFYCLLQSANWGLGCAEQATWLYKVKIDGEDKFGCGVWPESFANAEQSWPQGKPKPPGIFAQAHTHPTRCPDRNYGAKPSGRDQQLKIPVYTISPDGVYRWDPDTSRTTREPDNGAITKPNRCIDCDQFPKL